MLTLYWDDSSGLTQTLVLDAEISEQFSGEVEITDHPVEKGANISDHVRPKPATLRVDGLLVDAFRQGFASGSVVTNARPGLALRTFQQLEALRDAGALVTIQTPARLHEDLLIQSLSWQRDKTVVTQGPALLSQETQRNINGTGALRISMTLRSVRIVESQTVAVQKTKVTAAKGKVDAGKQTPTKATEAEKKKSLLKDLTNALSDAFKKPGVQ